MICIVYYTAVLQQKMKSPRQEIEKGCFLNQERQPVLQQATVFC